MYLLGECCDPLPPKALRASMGAAFRLGLWVEPSREKLCSQLEAQGFSLLASVPDGAATPGDARWTSPRGSTRCSSATRAMACGEETIARCRRVTIPMAGRAESLNAAAAAAILLWEMVTGCREGGLPWMTAPIGFGCSTLLGRAAPCLGGSIKACPAGRRAFIAAGRRLWNSLEVIREKDAAALYSIPLEEAEAQLGMCQRVGWQVITPESSENIPWH